MVVWPEASQLTLLICCGALFHHDHATYLTHCRPTEFHFCAAGARTSSVLLVVFGESFSSAAVCLCMRYNVRPQTGGPTRTAVCGDSPGRRRGAGRGA